MKKKCKTHNECAQAMLANFVMHVPVNYSEATITYNFHCLTHLASDALLYGSLESISAFKFENKLGQVKRLLKKKPHIRPVI